MNKTNISLLMFFVAPLFTFLLLSDNNSVGSKIIYLHDQKKVTRSSQTHLNSFSQVGNVILDFYADWCGPCKRMSPLIDDIAKTMPGFTFIKINRDFFSDLASTFKITSIPTLIFLKDGKEIGRYDGKPLTHGELAQLIAKVYGVNT